MTITNTYESKLTSRYTGRCTSSETYGNKKVKIVDREDPVHARRVREFPLWAHPTSIAKIHRSTTEAGVDWKGTWQNEVCGGVITKTKLEEKFSWHIDKVNDYNEPYPFSAWGTKLRNSISQHQVNLGVAVAEYRQTCSMFNQLATGAMTGWRRFRGRSRRRLTMDDVAATHLLGAFGLSPLLSDLDSSINRLNNRLDGSVKSRVRVVDRVHDEYKEQRSTYRWHRVVRDTEFEAISHILWKTQPPNFTLGNSAEVAWELVPYSFLVDYLIPIGDWLGAIDAMEGVKTHHTTLTIRDKFVREDTSPTNDPDLWTLLIPGKQTSESYERQVRSVIPNPPPRWDPSLSWRRVANVTALLRLFYSRHTRK